MDLGQLFENNLDCYTEKEALNKYGKTIYDGEEQAMTKEKFIEIVSKLISEGENKPTSEQLEHDGMLVDEAKRSELLKAYTRWLRQNDHLKSAPFPPLVTQYLKSL